MNARQVASDEELLKVLAGGAVDRILLEQEADLEGMVPALDETTPIHSDPTDQTMTPEELDALFGPAVDASESDAGIEEPPPARDDPAEAADMALSQDELDALVEQALETAHLAPPEPPQPRTAGGALSQNELDALFEQAAKAEARDQQTPIEQEAEGGALAQTDLNALFEQASGADAEEPQAETDEPRVEGEPLSQDDLDALFEKVAGNDIDGDDAGSAGAVETERETIDAGNVEALFAATGGKGESASEEPSEPDGDEPQEQAMTRAQLDDLLSQADRQETTATAAEAPAMSEADQLEAALDRQQADHPDDEETVEAAGAVSSAEQEALRASTAESPDSPVMSMADLDELLAGRSEKGAAQADLASDSFVAADEAPSITEVAATTAAITAVAAVAAAAAPPPAPPAGEQTIDQAVPAATEQPADDATEESDNGGPDLDVSVVVRTVCRVLGRIDEPFADLSPATKSALGYAGFALLFGALCLLAVALR